VMVLTLKGCCCGGEVMTAAADAVCCYGSCNCPSGHMVPTTATMETDEFKTLLTCLDAKGFVTCQQNDWPVPSQPALRKTRLAVSAASYEC
jgi:hypothetical protein